MANSNTKPMTVRTTEEVKEDFKLTYEASGATSQNEFLGKLLFKWNNPENIIPSVIEEPLSFSQEETQVILKTSFEASEAKTMDEFLDNLIQNFTKPEEAIEPDKETKSDIAQLKPNEILLSLSPAQLYAIRETVLSEGFTEDQNEIIDSLDYKKPGNHYYGQISEPEFQSLWIRNIVQTEGVTPEEKETATHHNIAAFLVNRFLLKFIDGKIDNSAITAKTLKSFIREHAEEVSCQFSVITNESNEIILRLSPAQLFAIRETVLSEGFGETQNEIFDSLNPESKPFFYSGNLYEPEFQSLWIRNIVQTEGMTPGEKETSISHNIGAFLVNMFLTHLIEGKISDTVVSAETLKSFIQDQE